MGSPNTRPFQQKRIMIGQYQIGEELGKGGYGQVYKAYKNNNVYAIKVVESKNQHQQYQSIQQAQIMKQINSEHFVKVYQYLKDKNKVCLIMELCETDLQYKLQEPNLTMQQRISYCCQIIKGVSYLHKNNLAHRDLKPGNILIKNGAIKITDLGIAKFIDRSRCQTVGGTLDFMAPQIFQGSPFNLAVDTYAIGLIILIILSGKRMKYFQNKGYVGCMRQFPTQQQLNLIEDQFFREIVRRCLKRNPYERIPVPEIASQLLIRQMQMENLRNPNSLLLLSHRNQLPKVNQPPNFNRKLNCQVQNYEDFIDWQIRDYIDLTSQK